MYKVHFKRTWISNTTPVGLCYQSRLVCVKVKV